ncbi:MAG: hypothetical protein AB7T49_08905 [Oligoflexales bacterium]
MQKICRQPLRKMFAALCLLASSLGQAAESKSPLLAVGQGIASPAAPITFFSNGFTRQNPVGVAWQKGGRVTLAHDRGDGDGNKGYGAELGLGQGDLGLAIGYYERDCDGCDETILGSVGFLMGGIGAGATVHEDSNTVGLMFGAEGNHRLGLVGHIYDGPTDDLDIVSYGLGYGFVHNNLTLVVDASKRKHKDEIAGDDLVLVTPGMTLSMSMIQVSVSYHMYLEDDEEEDDDDRNDLWWGLGIGSGDKFHLAVYGDYVNELSVAGSIFL